MLMSTEMNIYGDIFEFGGMKAEVVTPGGGDFSNLSATLHLSNN